MLSRAGDVMVRQMDFGESIKQVHPLLMSQFYLYKEYSSLRGFASHAIVLQSRLFWISEVLLSLSLLRQSSGAFRVSDRWQLQSQQTCSLPVILRISVNQID